MIVAFVADPGGWVVTDRRHDGKADERTDPIGGWVMYEDDLGVRTIRAARVDADGTWRPILTGIVHPGGRAPSRPEREQRYRRNAS